MLANSPVETTKTLKKKTKTFQAKVVRLESVKISYDISSNRRLELYFVSSLTFNPEWL